MNKLTWKLAAILLLFACNNKQPKQASRPVPVDTPVNKFPPSSIQLAEKDLEILKTNLQVNEMQTRLRKDEWDKAKLAAADPKLSKTEKEIAQEKTEVCKVSYEESLKEKKLLEERKLNLEKKISSLRAKP